MRLVVAISAESTAEHPFDLADMRAGLLARLDEFYPGDDGYPVVPAVEFLAPHAVCPHCGYDNLQIFPK